MIGVFNRSNYILIILFIVNIGVGYLFYWIFLPQPYEEVHNLFYGDEKASHLMAMSFDEQLNYFPKKFHPNLYLRAAKSSVDGMQILKYIRLSIEADPINIIGYDMLKVMIKKVPQDVDITDYLNLLYSIKNSNKFSLQGIIFQRYIDLENEVYQRRLLDNLELDARDQILKFTGILSE